VSGVPSFYINSFSIPPFLLPIYQAAGTAYGVPWQVLAAINEVETDYGRDLSLSSAGAEGWMQFLPSSWATYGVDANGDGFEDPYNPADAIFAAARYLSAAGAGKSLRAAIFSYNHSQTYVESVLLRAQLLGGTPPDLLDAITGLTEARFPVHAPSHFGDGFPSLPTGPSQAARTLPGTTIYSQDGAPVIAVQDGRVTKIGDSPTLGRYVSLRDAYGNTYTYAELGSVAALYPVLEPRQHTAGARRIARPGGSAAPAPSAPASAGVQSRSPVSEGAVTSSLALGAAAGLLSPAPAATLTPPTSSPATGSTRTAAPRVFQAGPDNVYLHPLRPGVQVIVGTVLGHVGAGAGAAPGGSLEPHVLFQIRPAGAGAPLIDPKPILDGWVALENTSIFRARGENPFLATSPTAGQVLLESKRQLQQQVVRDPDIRLSRCGRGEVQAGQVDRRLLAALEYLSVSGLGPTVSSLGCRRTALAAASNLSGSAAGESLDITAINGVSIAGHGGPGSVTDVTVRRLLRLQGTMKPRQIASSIAYPGAAVTVAMPAGYGAIHVSFAPANPAGARAAGAYGSVLTPAQWIALVARLGEIPDPTVPSRPSAAAIPDHGGAAATGAEGETGGNG